MNAPKKVLIYSTAYYPFVGGAEVAVREITDRLPDWQFDLVTARMDRRLRKKERIGRVNVYRAGPGLGAADKFLLPYFGFWRGLALCWLNKYDAIWGIMASQASIAAVRLKVICPRQRFVLTLQEGDEEDHLKRYAFGNERLYRLLIRPVHTWPIRRADTVTAISRYLADRAKSAGAKGEIRLIPNGVDSGRFREEIAPARRQKIRSDWGLKEGDRAILTVSRLVEKNAVCDLVRALKFLPGNFKLIIIGSGPEEERLKELMRTEKAEARVHFHGAVGHDRLPACYQAADVFSRPSLSEGFGNVFIEAMAAGLPVVATRVGGIVDFVRPPEEGGAPTGILVPPRDSRVLARGIDRLFKEMELREAIIENGRRLAAEKYDWDRIAPAMAAALAPVKTETA